MIDWLHELILLDRVRECAIEVKMTSYEQVSRRQRYIESKFLILARSPNKIQVTDTDKYILEDD